MAGLQASAWSFRTRRGTSSWPRARLAKAINGIGFIALDIRFATGSSTIEQDSLPQMAQVVGLPKANPTLRVGVEGHTDDVWEAVVNQALSESRARAVTTRLVAEGIAADRLTPAGFGESRPIDDNRLPDGGAKNRRVELVRKYQIY